MLLVDELFLELFFLLYFFVYSLITLFSSVYRYADNSFHKNATVVFCFVLYMQHNTHSRNQLYVKRVQLLRHTQNN